VHMAQPAGPLQNMRDRLTLGRQVVIIDEDPDVRAPDSFCQSTAFLVCVDDVALLATQRFDDDRDVTSARDRINALEQCRQLSECLFSRESLGNPPGLAAPEHDDAHAEHAGAGEHLIHVGIDGAAVNIRACQAQG